MCICLYVYTHIHIHRKKPCTVLVLWKEMERQTWRQCEAYASVVPEAQAPSAALSERTKISTSALYAPVSTYVAGTSFMSPHCGPDP